MAERNAPYWLINTYVAHPIRIPIEVEVDLPAELPGRIRMKTTPMGSAGLTPEQARELADALIEAAERAERGESGTDLVVVEEDEDPDDGVVCEVAAGVWFATSR